MAQSSERLPYRKKELEMADLLLHGLARSASSAALQQLQRRTPEPHKRRRIDGVGQIQPDGSHRRFVADAETSRMYGVIEVLEIALVETQRQMAYAPQILSECEKLPRIVLIQDLARGVRKGKPQFD